MKCILLLSFSHLPQFDWIFLSMNFHFFSSFSTWMIFHEISYLSCVLMNQYSLITWWKFLHSVLSSLSFLVEVFSSLTTFFFSHSLMLSQSLISPWWISFLPSFDELSFLILMNLPLLNLSYCLYWGSYQRVLDPLGQHFLILRFKHAYLISPPKV